MGREEEERERERGPRKTGGWWRGKRKKRV
jgi:hypothetical protein